MPDKPKTLDVPVDLVEQTLNILIQLPVAQGYLLAKQWEEIHPAFFTPRAAL